MEGIRQGRGGRPTPAIAPPPPAAGGAGAGAGAGAAAIAPPPAAIAPPPVVAAPPPVVAAPQTGPGEEKIRGVIEEMNTLKSPSQQEIEVFKSRFDIEISSFLDAGGDPNTKSNRGTPLIYIAADIGSEVSCRLLIGKEAGLNQLNNDGVTPLWVAAQNGHVMCVEVFIEALKDSLQAEGLNKALKKEGPGGVSPIWQAVQQGHVGVVQALIEAEADVNQARPSDGVTPLHIAAQEGKIQVVTELLSFKADNPKERYADPNSEDKRGRTPIFLAALKGQLAVVQALKKAGANPNQLGPKGSSPLWIAAQNGHADVVRFLLDGGADPSKVRLPWNKNPAQKLIAKAQTAQKAAQKAAQKVVSEVKAGRAFELTEYKDHPAFKKEIDAAIQELMKKVEKESKKAVSKERGGAGEKRSLMGEYKASISVTAIRKQIERLVEILGESEA